MKCVIVVLVIVSAFLFSGCQTNPVTGETEFVIISPEREKEMGADYAKEVEKELGKSIHDQQIQDYVNNVGQKIARVSHMPDYGFSYKAIDHNSVNAFAIPGGYIYITTGMLKQMNNESQLAAVLGHETAHVTARHIANQMTRDLMINLGLTAASYKVPTTALRVAGIVAQLEGMSFTRSQERQADQVGLDYLVKAGYTPNGMIETMEILEKQSESRPIEFLSTHPNPENRIGLIKENIFNNRYSSSGKVGKEEYAANVTERLKQLKPQQQEQPQK
ncbi:MAG: TPR repeat-containing protein YfgC precursor [Planctomycetes bacterium ADurb.Bin401]|nr:MAG: TPR repeat-containing protein YfgC precursor [Planctomycetes bacterium ADurb.Bin401]